MFIVHLDFDVAEADRPHALAVLRQEVKTVRAMPGCRRFTPFDDPILRGRVSVLHEWDSAVAFAAYLQSEAFRVAGEELRPLMVAPPSSRRFEARLIEDAA